MDLHFLTIRTNTSSLGLSLFVRGHLCHFMRPLCRGTGAKLEFRVIVNPCGQRQLKIILTSEERHVASFHKQDFFSSSLVYSPASILSFLFTTALPIVCADEHSLRIYWLIRTAGLLNNTPFFPSFKRGSATPPLLCLVVNMSWEGACLLSAAIQKDLFLL